MHKIYLALNALKRVGAMCLLLSGLQSAAQAQYCVPTYSSGCGSGDDINNFIFGTGGSLINHLNTGCSANAYGDFTGTFSPTVNPGQIIPFTVDHNYSSQALAIWIDADNDGTFSASEKVYASPTTGNTQSGTITIPMSASGLVRMRVRCIWLGNGSTMDPCTSGSFGEAHDYQLNVYSPPCVSPIVAGVATATQALYCPATPVVISVSGATIASGIQYQWQHSANGITWTNVAGQTGPTLNHVQSAAMNYRRRSICTSSLDTVYTNTVYADVEVFTNCYCAAAAYNTSDTDIHGVEIGSLNNFNTSGCNAYTNYSALQAPVLFKTLNYPMTVKVGSCSGYTYDSGVAVYIDFNQNGSFGDPGELVMWTPNTVPTGALTDHIGNVNIPLAAVTGVTKMRVIALEGYDGNTINSCGTTLYSYGEVEDYLVNIAPQPADEVALMSIDSPNISNCSFNNDLKVTIKNNGSNALTSVDFAVNTGGLIQNVTWTGNIATMASQQITVPGIFSYNSGDTLGVAVSNPNGSPDVVLTDNYKGTRTYLALQGVYKVGYGVTNLDSIIDIPTAITKLHDLGVCGTVYFDIKPGIYTGHYTINQYPGWSTGNKAIFRSATLNALDVVLKDSSTSTATNFIFNLDGADGIGLQHLTINPRSATYRTSVNIKNGAHEFMADSCRFIADTSMTGIGGSNFDQIHIRSADATTEHGTTLTNNIFKGGSRIVNLGPLTGEYENGLVIKNNTLTHVGVVAILIESQLNAVIENNTIKIPSNSTFATPYGVYFINTAGMSFTGNDLQMYKPGFAAEFEGLQGSSAQSAIIANNFVYLEDSGSTASYGIRVTIPTSNNIMIANNSISTNSNLGYALQVVDGTNVQFMNNNIASTGMSGLVSFDKTYSLLASNNNNLFHSTNVSTFRYGSTTHATLADWQSASSFDAASISVNPNFVGPDLHTCVLALDGAAMPLAIITNDIDGDVRQSASDIGADEFVGSALGLITQDAFIKCPNESITMGAPSINGVTYSWSNGATTSEVTTNVAGQFVLTASNTCGTFMDTVQVTNKPATTAAFNIGAGVGLAVQLNNTSTNAVSYSWNFGDGQTSTQSNPTHIYAVGDVYIITLTAYGECDTVTTTLTYNANANSVEGFDNADIRVYPNPTKHQINLAFGDVEAGAFTFKVLDVSGKVVMVNEANVSSGSLMTLDVQHLVPGIYFIQANSNKASSIFKFVKQ